MRVYNLSGVVAGGGMLSMAATAALAGGGVAITVTDGATTATLATTAAVAAFALVASKYSAKLGMLLFCNFDRGEETKAALAGNAGGSCNLPYIVL